jgi:glycosyltransferase involved in cell wall biosynthesis
MKIGFVSPYYKPAYTYGGTVSSAAALCESLAAAGEDVTVITTNANGDAHLDVALGEPVWVEGVRVFYYASGRNNRITYIPALQRACEVQLPQFDVVIAEILWSFLGQTIRQVCHRAGVPYVVTPHGQLLPWAMNKGWLKKRLFLRLFARSYLEGAAFVRATDPSEAEALAAFKLASPIVTIPNSIDTARFESLPPRGSLRQKQGIAPDALVLLFLGRLHPKKRPDIAVTSLIAARRAGLNAHLILAGPDEENLAHTLAGIAEQNDAAAFLHLTGLLQGDAVLEALADADLMLMPSAPQSENFGMVALEAMAAGLPVLLSDDVPVGATVAEVNAGRQVPCDEHAFGSTTVEMLSDPATLRTMGTRGQAAARTHYDNSSVTQKFINHLNAIRK